MVKILFILLFLSCPVPAQEVRLPGDGLLPFDENRKIVDATAPEWASVGRLNVSGNRHCTAVLVGPELVLTAAHCLYSNRGQRWVEPDEIHFLPGYQRGEFVAHALIARYELGQTIKPDLMDGLSRIANDWALLHISEVKGGTLPPPLAVRDTVQADIAASQSFIQGGYHGTRPHVLTANMACTLLNRPGMAFLVHDCALGGGDSGSPLLVLDKNGQPMIIGLNVANMNATNKTGKGHGIALISHQFWEALQAAR